jgi:hypothetical protein
MKKAVYITYGLVVVAGLAGCVYTSVITAAGSVTPETTSMLYLSEYIDRFDNAIVNWSSNSGIYEKEEHGVIIPSGRHTLGRGGFSVTYDFKPGGFYRISSSGYNYDGSYKILISDYTEL